MRPARYQSTSRVKRGGFEFQVGKYSTMLETPRQRQEQGYEDGSKEQKETRKKVTEN